MIYSVKTKAVLLILAFMPLYIILGYTTHSNTILTLYGFGNNTKMLIVSSILNVYNMFKENARPM